MKYMLDTNICIYAIKQNPKQVLEHLKKHHPDELCISTITYSELIHGVEKNKAIERNRLALMMMLSNIEIMDFDSSAAEQYGKIRADLEKAGMVIGPFDLLIAGHALAQQCILVTNNTNEFERINGLILENWAV